MTSITAPTTKFSSFDTYKLGAAGGTRRAPSSRSVRSVSSVRSHSGISPKQILIVVLVAASVLAVMLPATTAFGRRSLVSSERPSAADIAKTHAESKSDTISVVVHSGDTLWSIARRLEPNNDPREVVDQLVQSRGTTNVYAGETITWQR